MIIRYCFLPRSDDLDSSIGENGVAVSFMGISLRKPYKTLFGKIWMFYRYLERNFIVTIYYRISGKISYLLGNFNFKIKKVQCVPEILYFKNIQDKPAQEHNLINYLIEIFSIETNNIENNNRSAQTIYATLVSVRRFQICAIDFPQICKNYLTNSLNVYKSVMYEFSVT